MKKAYGIRSCLVLGAAVAVALLAPPAQAASKEIIALQTQVQQLLDMVQRLQSTVDARFGGMQRLVEQTADNAAQISQVVNTLSQKINAQADATSGKLDTTSGQIQSLNDSVDELKTRIGKLDKSIQDLQTQLQNIQNPPPGTTQPGATPGGDTTGGAPGAPTGAPMANQAPPLQPTFQAALRDYNAAKYDVAAGEFQDVMKYYPQDDLAGEAQFYLGEIAYKQGNFSDAVNDYNAVLEQYSGSRQAPAAQLRKGLALLQMGRRESAIHELRQLIQRHPQTPEAAQARSKLNGMGVRIQAAR
jgi:tol-pal system protein YbgF